MNNNSARHWITLQKFSYLIIQIFQCKQSKRAMQPRKHIAEQFQRIFHIQKFISKNENRKTPNKLPSKRKDYNCNQEKRKSNPNKPIYRNCALADDNMLHKSSRF